MQRFFIAATLAVLGLLNGSVSQAQVPVPDFTWNNFVSVGTNWSVAANWNPAASPSSSIDRILGFGSSTLQTGSGYTATNDAASAFDLNSIVASASSFSGGAITINSSSATGTLRLNTSSAGAGSISPSIWQTGTGRLQIRHGTAGALGITIANAANLNIRGSGVGDVFLDTSIGESGGAGSLTINHAGTRNLYTGGIVRLGGSNSNFSGGVTLTAGNLLLSNVLGTTGANNFGTAALIPVNALGTGTFTVGGGTIRFDPSATTASGGSGGTFQVANAINLTGTMTLTGTFNGAVNSTGAATGTFLPVGNIAAVFSGNISGGGGITMAPTSGLTSSGTVLNQTINFTLSGSNSFSGPLVIRPDGNTNGTLFLGGATLSGGTLATNSISVFGGSSLTLNNVFGAVSGRLTVAGGPNLNLNRSEFQIWGNATTSVAEQINTLTGSGNTAISLFTGSTTSTTVTTTITNFTRATNATLTVLGTNLGSGAAAGKSILTITNDPGGAVGGGGGAGTFTRNILPYAVVNSAATITGTGTLNTFNFNGLSVAAPVIGLARWDSGTGNIVPLDTATEYATNLFSTDASLPNTNHRYVSTAGNGNTNGVAGLNASQTVNAIVLDSNSAATVRMGVSLHGTGAITLAGPLVVGTNGTGGAVSNPSMVNLGGLAFANTGYIHAVSSVAVNSPISGSNGVVKSGFGTLFLTGSNPFTGGLTINSGVLQFGEDTALGATGGTVTLNNGPIGSGLNYLPYNLYQSPSANQLTLNRPVVIADSGGTTSVTLANMTLTLAGGLSGSGTFTKTGSGTLELTGTNTFTGNLLALGGFLQVANDASLGAASSNLMLMNGGTLRLSGSITSNRDYVFPGSSTIFTNGFNLTLNGNLTSQFNSAYTMLKDGAGDVTITSASTYLGAIQVGGSAPTVRGTGYAQTTGGRLILSGPNGSLSSASGILMLSGGELVLDNSGAVGNINQNRVGTTNVSNGGGTFTIIGNANGNINEGIGLWSMGASTAAPYGATLTLDTPAGGGTSTTLTATSLSGNTTIGTYFIRGTNLGAVSGDRSSFVLSIATAPTLTPASVGILPAFVGATSSSSDPTTFLTTSLISIPGPNVNQYSFVPFNSYTTANSALGTITNTNTYDVTGAASTAGASSANALRINAGGSLDLGGGTLTLNSAHVLSAGGVNGGITNGTMAFGANVARLTVASGSDLTVPAMSGTAGFIKYGNGTLTLNGVSTFGTVTTVGIGQGTIRYGVANALPATSTVFISSGATLNLNNNNATIAALNGYGTVALGTATLTLNSATAPSVAFGGSFTSSGAGTIDKQNTNAIVFNGDNSGYAGGITIRGGTVTVGGNQSLGTGTVIVGDTTGTNRVTLTLGANVTSFANPITIAAGATLAASAPHILNAPQGVSTISSNIAINHVGVNTTSGGITVNNLGLQLGGTSGNGGAYVNQTGVISGNAGIYLFSGNWSMQGDNTYAGGTFIDTTTTNAVGIGRNSTPTSGVLTSGPFGTGVITFSTGFGANLRADGGPRSIGNNIVLSPTGGYFGTTGVNALTFNGTVDLQTAAASQSFHIANTAVTTFNGAIQNSTNGITKNGPGVLRLNGVNTYSGTTIVNAGTLLISNTTGTGITSAVTVNAGAVLGGSGSINGAVTLNTGGMIAAGNSVGTLTQSGGLSFATGSYLGVFIADGSTPAAISTGGSTIGTIPNPTSNNFLDITSGTVTGLDTNAILRVDLANTPFVNQQNYSYRIGRGFGDLSALNVTATNRFSFFNLSPGTVNINTASLTGDAGGNVFLNFVPVPEPMTILAIGLAGLVVGRRLRRRVND